MEPVVTSQIREIIHDEYKDINEYNDDLDMTFYIEAVNEAQKRRNILDFIIDEEGEEISGELLVSKHEIENTHENLVKEITNLSFAADVKVNETFYKPDSFVEPPLQSTQPTNNALIFENINTLSPLSSPIIPITSDMFAANIIPPQDRILERCHFLL